MLWFFPRKWSFSVCEICRNFHHEKTFTKNSTLIYFNFPLSQTATEFEGWSDANDECFETLGSSFMMKHDEKKISVEEKISLTEKKSFHIFTSVVIFSFAFSFMWTFSSQNWTHNNKTAQTIGNTDFHKGHFRLFLMQATNLDIHPFLVWFLWETLIKENYQWKLDRFTDKSEELCKFS